MKLRFIELATLAGALLVAGCTEISTPTEPIDLSPSLAIWDAEHGDEGSHFYFLPPMVPDPDATGIFDATQPAVVEVCEWTGTACALTLVDFSVDAGTITTSVEDEHYLALWHAGDFELDLTKVYRVRVLVGPQELGYADVQPVANGSGLKNLVTGEVIGLVDNRTLPIKLRIEEGAIDGGTTIDATALTSGTFFIGGIGGFPSATPQVLDLAPGAYTVQDGTGPGGTHAFEITTTGLVSYAPEKEPFFDGLGTTQLTLVGYDVSIDATGLTASQYFLGGIGGSPSGTVGTFTFLPGGKTIQDGSGGVHAFQVTEAGLIAYAVEKEPFFGGSGTTQLTVVGYDVVFDATALAAPVFSLGGIGSFSSTVAQSVTTLPGNKGFNSVDTVFAYEIQENGLFDYEAALDPLLSGRNTDTLTITP